MTIREQRRRDAIAALSISNLTFVRTWNELLTYSREQSFFLTSPPGPSLAIAAALNVLMLGTLMYAVFRVTRRVAARFGARWGLLVAAVVLVAPLNSIGGILSVDFPSFAPRAMLENLHGLSLSVVIIAAIAVVAAAIRWPGWTLKIGSIIAIQLAPLIPLEGAFVAWHAATDRREAFVNFPVAPKLPEKPGAGPVVWLLIDELDYRLLFQDRPAGLKLTHFDQLRNESIFASHALSPATMTLISVPSLLTGKSYASIETAGPDLMQGRMSKNGPATRITANDTIFGAAHELGFNVVVAGWYLPYCRAFGAAISECIWYSMGNRINVDGQSFFQKVVNQAQAPFETATYSPFALSVLARHRAFNARGIERDTREILSRQTPGFVYIHHMATHAPYIYDRMTKTFTKRNSPVQGYVDALQYADSYLGGIREAMESAGTWDQATILVTADHGFRRSRELDGKSDPRVPWLLKMPHQKRGEALTGTLRTIVTRKLLEAIMRGEVRNEAEVVAWIGSNQSALVEAASRP